MTNFERLDLIRRLSEIRSQYNCFNEKERKVYHTLSEAIEVMQEQKTGKWKPWKAYYGKDHKSLSDELKCSVCGFKWGDEEYKYCPNCGAKMENVQ